MRWVNDDGGRAAAGFKGSTGDCVTRAIAIATGIPYADVYRDLAALAKSMGFRGTKASPRNGVDRKVYDAYLGSLGWVWTATMKIGSGCRVHLTEKELPEGRIIVRLTRHLSAVVDGEIRDTFNPSRDGTRCVYGYWAPGYWVPGPVPDPAPLEFPDVSVHDDCDCMSCRPWTS